MRLIRAIQNLVDPFGSLQIVLGPADLPTLYREERMEGSGL